MPAPQKTPRGGCDAISQHLRAIGRIPLLTPDEEINLARSVQRGRRLLELAEEMTLRSGGQQPSRDAWALEAQLTPQQLTRQLRQAERAQARMVTANLRLVVSLARRYGRGQLELEDLIQEGTLGLIRAVERFDPTRGYRFSTYATWWIRDGIGRALEVKSRSIRLPASLLDLLSRLRQVQHRLAQELGRQPSLEDLSAATGLKPLDIQEALFRAQQPLSLDVSFGMQEDLRLVDTLRCTATIPQERVAAGLFRQDLAALLGELQPLEAELMRLRYGIDREAPMTLSATARTMGITRDTARGIERRAMASIRLLSERVIDYLRA